MGCFDRLPRPRAHEKSFRKNYIGWQLASGRKKSERTQYRAHFESDAIDILLPYWRLVSTKEKATFELQSQNRLTLWIVAKIHYSDFQTEQKQSVIN